MEAAPLFIVCGLLAAILSPNTGAAAAARASELPVTAFSTGGHGVYHLRPATVEHGTGTVIISAAYDGSVLSQYPAGALRVLTPDGQFISLQDLITANPQRSWGEKIHSQPPPFRLRGSTTIPGGINASKNDKAKRAS